MNNDFWHERWALNEIGFHRKDTNSFLVRYWPTLETKATESIFVPLCGKSLDLIWLSQRCKHVIGVELSNTAIEDFFSEQQLEPSIKEHHGLTRYQYGNITLFCGDFFQLRSADFMDCSLIYDRASLIALPPLIRQQYADKLEQLFPHPHKRLLITLDYDQQLMNGPPFAVTPEEVNQLFVIHHQLRCLESIDIIEDSQRFKDKGLNSLIERIYILESSKQ
ncbi:MAG: thiopurine S-methyltransferase [Cycloclasticus sp. symbiont of Bathymodiolus heckerae]|nr:MAG: thiopurine S-methyltransferase [Cycloclasticus sp. symbiont of Bathymodiolus heckerae]